jgi:hypothetical protein
MPQGSSHRNVLWTRRVYVAGAFLLLSLLGVQVARPLRQPRPGILESSPMQVGETLRVDLLDLNGNRVSLRDREESCLHVIFVDPGCPACAELMEASRSASVATAWENTTWISGGDLLTTTAMAQQHGLRLGQVWIIDPKVHPSRTERLIAAGVPMVPLYAAFGPDRRVLLRRFLPRLVPHEELEAACRSALPSG